jgi:hypothetical protein
VPNFFKLPGRLPGRARAGGPPGGGARAPRPARARQVN